MDHLTLHGTMTAADVPGRTVTYRLLPFGEPGRTSAGLVTVPRGVVTMPAPPDVVLNIQHDPTRPVGRGATFTDAGTGIDATFTVLPTRDGDDLLTELAAGVRPGVSVELADVGIRDGVLTAGRLTGAGAVVAPAFPSALLQLVAADTDPDTGAEPAPAPVPATADPDAPAPDDDEDPDAPAPDTTTPEDPTVDTTLTAAAPASLTAGAPAAGAAMTLPTLNGVLQRVQRGERSPELLAALADITYSAASEVMPPQWIRDVWAGNPYQRSIVPLLNSAPLTGMTVLGWRWATPPTGATYAGNKTDVASNAAATEAVTFNALRWAGAHDVDRAFVDFNVDGFWESYWAAMAASYGLWSDTQAAALITAGATTVVAAGEGVVAAIIAGALAVMPYGPPSFVLLDPASYTALALTDPLAFLSGSIQLTTGEGNVGGLSFRAVPGQAANTVLVGTRNAATVYELPGSPIRVDAVNVANGGVDVGAFGYLAAGINQAKGLAKVAVIPVTPPAGFAALSADAADEPAPAAAKTSGK